jgi:hypothetical protein
VAIAGMGYRLAAGGLGRRPPARRRDEAPRPDGGEAWRDDDLWPEDEGPCLEDALVAQTARAWTRLRAETGRMTRAALAARPPGWVVVGRRAVSARTAGQVVTVCVVAALGCSTWLCWQRAREGGRLSVAVPTLTRTAALAPPPDAPASAPAAAHAATPPPPPEALSERAPEPAPVSERAPEPAPVSEGAPEAAASSEEAPAARVVEARAAPVRSAVVQRVVARAALPAPRVVRARTAAAAPPRAVTARVSSARFDLPAWLTRPRPPPPPPVRIMSPPPRDLSLPHPPLVVAGPTDRFARRT